MIARGIFTTKADFWVHLFPFEAVLYWYLVRHMREYIGDVRPIAKIGRSVDGTATGSGYLIKRDAPFVRRGTVPDAMLNAFNWGNGTDREVGLIWGEQIIDWMINTGALRIPFFTAEKLERKAEQFDFGDFGIQLVMPRLEIIEVKTERIASGNLFVQTKEKGHRVHQKKVAGNIVEDYVNVPDLK